MDCDEIIFTMHAVQRLFERPVRPAEMREIIEHGELIAEYPSDLPYPSRLILGWNQGRPIHAVLSADPVQKKCYVITVYQPAPNLWNHDYKKRIT